MKFDNETEIAYAVAVRFFGIRKCVCVPNVSWGLLRYEADLLVLTGSDYLYEVEIKTSYQDLKRDKNKKHQHHNNICRKLFFAIPEKLRFAINEIQERAGIIIIKHDGWYDYIRPAMINKNCPKLDSEKKFQLARLGAMRMWKWIRI